MNPEVDCLPECDETHAGDCPVAAAEMKWWANYFRAHPEKPSCVKSDPPEECLRHDWDKHGLCLGCGISRFDQ